MLNSTVLQKDGSWDTFLAAEGLPKALHHKALALEVDTSTWYVYHQRNYDPTATAGDTAYNEANWYPQQ